MYFYISYNFFCRIIQLEEYIYIFIKKNIDLFIEM